MKSLSFSIFSLVTCGLYLYSAGCSEAGSVKNIAGDGASGTLINASLPASLAAADDRVHPVSLKARPGRAIAAFSEGCFWHSEIIFESLEGVDSVVSGYAGGKTVNPGYEDVSTGTTGHAETALIYYDPKKISFSQILNAFFVSHDPTQLNRQGNDVGPQYRSVAFYQTPQEKAEISMAIAQAQKASPGKLIVTQVMPLTKFYRAEEYHQNYIAHNPNEGYVQNVCIPEYHEFLKAYKGPLKKPAF